MSKRANVFAKDFQSITKSADDAVFEFLKKGEAEKQSSRPALVEEVLPSTKEEPEAKTVKPAEVTAKEERPRTKRVKESVAAKPKPSQAAKEWGKPVALFNTRIPQEMSDLLDDLVYRLRKEGKPHTKQAIAIEALSAYLAKSGLFQLPSEAV